MSVGKQVMAWLTLGGIVAFGWTLMKFTVPSKEDILKVNTPINTHSISEEQVPFWF